MNREDEDEWYETHACVLLGTIVLFLWYGLVQFFPWGTGSVCNFSATSGESYVSGAPGLVEAPPGKNAGYGLPSRLKPSATRILITQLAPIAASTTVVLSRRTSLPPSGVATPPPPSRKLELEVSPGSSQQGGEMRLRLSLAMVVLLVGDDFLHPERQRAWHQWLRTSPWRRMAHGA